MATRVGMVSLGCPKNQVDAEHMLFDLKKEGFQIVQDAALADYVIVNTCGFIESAKQEAIETILEFCTLKKEGRIKAVIVTGCLAQRYGEEMLKEIPEADAIVGLGENKNLCEIIRDIAVGEKNVCKLGKCEDLALDGGRIISTNPFYAYLKISEGCSNCCTYCAIPSIRGKFRSRPMESIIQEAKWLAENGVTEIVVIAQDTTRYGEDLYGKPSLAALLKELCKIDGLKWIRTLYCYPERITEELIKTVAEEPKLVKYFDIPLQHCNKEILKKMNRHGDYESLKNLINHIREEIPEVIIRTTFIAGFPSETDEQFEELSRFVGEMKFDRMGCFAYSQEENTPAAKMPEQIDEEEKEKRADVIMEQQMFISGELNDKKIDRIYEVVTEGFDQYAECFYGRSVEDAPEIDGKIFFDCGENKPRIGDYVKVRINDTLDYDLIGERIED